ncbi:MAG: HEPN domain-containing protein [Oligoflexia bacterium]|nr:HEPN domain-containing protein [Oligoflexia bacterium]
MLKAHYLLITASQPPFTHSLTRLYSELVQNQGQKIEINDGIDFQKFLERLEPYYIQARYPSYRDQISKELSREHLEQSIKRTEVVISWFAQNKKS